MSAVLSYATSKSLINGQDVTTDEKLAKLLGKSGTFPAQTMNQLVKAHFKK
jgi:hypothetical protein